LARYPVTELKALALKSVATAQAIKPCAEHPTLRSVDGMTPEDQAALARAVQSLEHPGFAARLTSGASVNYVFIEHFQEIAQGHFTVRRLERVYGKDIIRAEYERLAQDH
jgi:hypothetical protein